MGASNSSVSTASSATTSAASSYGNSYMAGASAIQGITAIGTSIAQASAIKAQGDFQSSMFGFNQAVAKAQADDALKRGEQDVKDLKSEVRQTIGAQRASLAAQGIEVDTGSAADIQRDTEEQGAIAMIRIKNNAWREAWGYKTQAAEYDMQAELARFSSANQYRNTLVSGGLSGLSYGMQSAYYYGGAGTPKLTK